MRSLFLLSCLFFSIGVFAQEPPAGRLPDVVRPIEYWLDLTLDPRATGLSGTVDIQMELKEATDLIWIHGKDLRVMSVIAQSDSGNTISGEYQQELDSGVAALRFASALPAGMATVRIEYEADYNLNLAGLFKVEEQGDAYVLAKSESIQARRFLPSFDEPGMKAVFNMRLAIPEGNTVIANTPETGRESTEGGMERITFAPTRPMSTYLLSLAAGPFDVVERPPLPANRWRKDPVPLRGIARRGRGDDLKHILDVTPEMLAVFEEALQQPYPYKKLDIVAAPQWPSGATELSAAITYREERILLGDKPAPGARLSMVNVHAHEIAHMWFGNLVTPPWWDDLWLKEGFATWGTPLALTKMEPDGGHDLAAAKRAASAMRLDSLASTRAIREDIESNDDIRNAYDSITYSKSLGVIHMVDQFFGPDVFRPALGRYIANFADGQAASPAFYEEIARETRTPAVAETFRSFVEQKGVPLLKVTLLCEAGTPQVTLNMERYRPLGSLIEDHGVQWNIPVCLRDDTGAKQCKLLTERRSQIALAGAACPAWVLPNAGGAGYYRFSLPPALWAELLESFEELTPVEALSVIDSAIAAFESGDLPAEQFLELLQASSKSERRQIVTAPLGAIKRNSNRYFSDEERQALGDKIGPWYVKALEQAQASGDADSALLSYELEAFLADVLRRPDAREALREQAVAFTGFDRERNAEALSSDLYQPALSVAIQDLGEPFLKHLIEFRGEVDNPKFEGASAKAIGSINDEVLLPLLWEQVLSGDFGSREAYDALKVATSTSPVAARNWTWVEDNFPAIVEKIPAQWRRRTPTLAVAFCDNEMRTRLSTLFEKYGDLAPGYRRALDQTDERIQLCDAQRGQSKALAAVL
ncbi:MAG: M1 family metallopeptidase [Pseudomonadota bacterium]